MTRNLLICFVAMFVVGVGYVSSGQDPDGKAKKLSPEQRCRIVLGALKNADGSPFVDSDRDTLARHIAGVIGGSQGEQAVTGDLASQCKLALEIWRQTWTQHVVTREANIKARVAAENEKTKVTSELNFGESLLPQQAKP